MKNNNLQTSSLLSIEEELLTKEKWHKLLKLMSGLSVLDRDVLVMKFIQGSSNKEIAIKTGMLEATIEDRIYQTLRKLT